MKNQACYLIAALILFLGSVTAQTTLSVPSAAHPTIQSAINAAVTGDTVLVAAGTYVENLVWGNQDITVQGAGVGQSIIDGNQSGSCLVFNQVVGPASALEGFTLTNGSGTPLAITLQGNPFGGGLCIDGTIGDVNPTIRHCEFTGNSAYQGGGIFIAYGGAAIEDCRISGNTNSTFGPGGRDGASFWTNGTVTMRRCHFDQQDGESVLYSHNSFYLDLVLTDCDFVNNTCTSAVVYVGAKSLVMSGCRFAYNSGTGALLAVVNGSAQQSVIRDCLFHGNSASVLMMSIVTSTNHVHIDNVTIAKNTVPGTYGTVAYSGFVDISHAIVQSNFDLNGQPISWSLYQGTPTSVATVANSNIRGSGGLPGVVDVDPMFVDLVNGDYRLAPGSPMIDAGTASLPYALSATDFNGHDRVRGNSVDIGAFEAQSPGHSQFSAGRVGETAGGPFEIFTINGSTGGVLRRITAPIGASATMEMQQPPSAVGPCQFSIFGIVGEASFDTEVVVPLAIGGMVFAPVPLAPYLQPQLFLLASSVGPVLGVPPLFTATPTPWNSGLGAAIPFPLTITLQGVIEEAPGIFTPTNTIAYIVE